MKKLREVLNFASDCDHIEILDETGVILFAIPEEGNMDDMLLPNYEVIAMRYNSAGNTCYITVNDTPELTLGSIMDHLSGNVIILNKYLDEIGMITKENVIRGDGKDGNLAEEPVCDICAVGNKVYIVVRG